jgi:hypothetical protein
VIRNSIELQKNAPMIFKKNLIFKNLQQKRTLNIIGLFFQMICVQLIIIDIDRIAAYKTR